MFGNVSDVRDYYGSGDYASGSFPSDDEDDYIYGNEGFDDEVFMAGKVRTVLSNNYIEFLTRAKYVTTFAYGVRYTGIICTIR